LKLSPPRKDKKIEENDEDQQCLKTSMIREISNHFAIASSYYYKINYLDSIILSFETNVIKDIQKHFTICYQHQLKSCCCHEKVKPFRRCSCSSLHYSSKLYGDITTLRLIHNLIDLDSFKKKDGTIDLNSIPSDEIIIAKSSLFLDEKFNSKRCLGHLISRNFLRISIDCLDQINILFKYFKR
jgi:hypothetical protein